MPSPDPGQAVQVLRALGHPLRYRLLRLLAGIGTESDDTDPCAGCQVFCPCRMRLFLKVSAPDLSHHLKVLKDAGLIEGRREGNLVHYRPRVESLRAVLPALHELAGPGEDNR